MAIPTIVNRQSVSASANGTLTVVLSGASSGDLIIAFVGGRVDNTTVGSISTTNTTYKLYASNEDDRMHSAIFFKESDGNDDTVFEVGAPDFGSTAIIYILRNGAINSFQSDTEDTTQSEPISPGFTGTVENNIFITASFRSTGNNVGYENSPSGYIDLLWLRGEACLGGSAYTTKKSEIAPATWVSIYDGYWHTYTMGMKHYKKITIGVPNGLTAKIMGVNDDLIIKNTL